MKKRPKVGFLSKSTSRHKGRMSAISEKTSPKDPFDGKEYYLLHNFGFERKIIFSSKEDYDRFEAYLYLLNAIESPRASNYFLDGRESSIFSAARGEKLIAIGAYSFTPKEFHILATPLVEKGIARFMQKLQTAYTMYFNKKYVRSGRLFHSRYESEVAYSDDHLKYIFASIHLNPAVLFNDEWESKEGIELESLAASAMKYRYSSANEYMTATPLITTPIEFPKYLSGANDARKHVQFWLKNRPQV